jgi:hypothetical protein
MVEAQRWSMCAEARLVRFARLDALVQQTTVTKAGQRYNS